MKKSVLGTRIQALRKEKGITQEELGKALGVTAQAVSNWECGGTPDAELLPYIADYFQVSVDNLFGRTDEVKSDLGKSVLMDLYNTKQEERFEKAFQYCWSIQQGVFNMEPEIVEGILQDRLIIPDSMKANSFLYFAGGTSVMRINKDTHSFFLMPTPKDGMESYLLEPEKYEKLFSVLGKPGRVKTLLFLYKRKSLALSAARLAKYLNMQVKEAEEILQDLCSLDLLRAFETDAEEGEQTLYKVLEFYMGSVLLIPLLVAATDLIDKPICSFNNASGDRETLL